MTGARSVPFGRPLIDDRDINAVLEVLKGHILTHGPECKSFEQEFSQFLGEGAHSVTMSSCAAALNLAYFYMGIGPGDEVLVPAQTHTATVHAVELAGARPVFVDCEPETGNINYRKIQEKITSRTRAISVVHFLGIPCDMERIVEVSREHDLKVIEDCALAVGSRINGKHVGLFGDAGCFSFYPVKHITTGEGGMFISRHKEVAESVAKLRAFGIDRSHSERVLPGMYDVAELGFNYRMSEMQAALGRQQLKKVEEILSQRKSNFIKLKSYLTNLEGVRVLDSPVSSLQNSHYCLTVVLTGPEKGKRDLLVRSLNELGIGTSIYYPHPVNRFSYYKKKYGYEESQYTNAAEISDCSIALPVGPHLNSEDIDYIGENFVKVIKEIK
jgi:perosamine synthetase